MSAQDDILFLLFGKTTAQVVEANVRARKEAERDRDLWRAMARDVENTLHQERAFASVAITFWRAVAASMVKP